MHVETSIYANTVRTYPLKQINSVTINSIESVDEKQGNKFVLGVPILINRMNYVVCVSIHAFTCIRV